MAALDRLRRKYGKSIDDVLAYGEEIRSKISQMENKDQLLNELKRELAAKAAGLSRSGPRALPQALRRRPQAGEDGRG